MLAPAAMLGAAAGTAAAAGGGGGGGPTGPPTNASMFKNGEQMAIQWSNGDATAQSQIGTNPSASADPTSVTYTVAPGVTSVDVADCDILNPSCYWYVRHIKNAQTTDWVLGTGCSGELCAE